MTESSPVQSSPKHSSSAPCSNLRELWDYDRPAESEQRFHTAAVQAHARGDAGGELEALTQKARSQGLQQRFDEAHATLDSVETRLDGATANRVTLRLKLERGRVFNSSGEKPDALSCFVDAWNLARNLGADDLAVDAAHMMAIAILPNNEAALSWNIKALELAEHSLDPGALPWRAPLYNNVGWTYFEQKLYDLALAAFQRALELREQATDVKPRLIARWTLPRVWRAQGRFDRALNAQLQLLHDYELNGVDSNGYVHEELGECLLALGRDGAAHHFQEAFDKLSKDPWLASEEPTRLMRLKQLGASENEPVTRR